MHSNSTTKSSKSSEQRPSYKKTVTVRTESIEVVPPKSDKKVEKQSSTTSIKSTSTTGKMTRAEFLKAALTRALDEVDARVTFLRETVLELDEEKRKLAEALDDLEKSEHLEMVDEGMSAFQGRARLISLPHQSTGKSC